RFGNPWRVSDSAGWYYTDYGADANYGTDTNFQNNYRMTGTFIDTWKAPFTTEDRIWISGADVFQTQVADFDALLTSHGVLHTLSTPTNAVAGLYGLVQSIGIVWRER